MDKIAIQISRTRVNEGDSFPVNLAFVDLEGETTEAPDTVDFRVDCLTTGHIMVDWTTAAPGDTSSIQIDSAANALQVRSNRTERRQLTVRANRDATTQVSGQVRWTVRNQDFL
jgi:hypothetical protein